MTDTPIQPQTWPRPSQIDTVKAFVGDLARPLSIILASSSASIATIIIAFRVTTFGEGALFIGAVWTGVGLLYSAKALEVASAGKQAANVEIAKATTPGATQ